MRINLRKIQHAAAVVAVIAVMVYQYIEQMEPSR